jgi:hypothetical protein
LFAERWKQRFSPAFTSIEYDWECKKYEDMRRKRAVIYKAGIFSGSICL